MPVRDENPLNLSKKLCKRGWRFSIQQSSLANKGMSAASNTTPIPRNSQPCRMGKTIPAIPSSTKSNPVEIRTRLVMDSAVFHYEAATAGILDIGPAQRATSHPYHVQIYYHKQESNRLQAVCKGRKGRSRNGGSAVFFGGRPCGMDCFCSCRRVSQ